MEHDLLPDNGRSNPGQPGSDLGSSSSRARAGVASGSKLAIAASGKGVEAILAKVCSNEIVVELTYRHHVLGNGRIGSTSP